MSDNLKLRLIACRNGESKGDNPRPWYNVTGVTECRGSGGLTVEAIVSAFVSADQHKVCSRLMEKHGAGTVCLHIADAHVETDRGQVVNKTGDKVWRTNHNLVRGKFVDVTLEPRSTGITGTIVMPGDDDADEAADAAVPADEVPADAV